MFIASCLLSSKIARGAWQSLKWFPTISHQLHSHRGHPKTQTSHLLMVLSREVVLHSNHINRAITEVHRGACAGPAGVSGWMLLVFAPSQAHAVFNHPKFCIRLKLCILKTGLLTVHLCSLLRSFPILSCNSLVCPLPSLESHLPHQHLAVIGPQGHVPFRSFQKLPSLIPRSSQIFLYPHAVSCWAISSIR